MNRREDIQELERMKKHLINQLEQRDRETDILKEHVEFLQTLYDSKT